MMGKINIIAFLNAIYLCLLFRKSNNNTIDEVLNKIKTSIDNLLYGPRNINRNNSETSEHQQI
jgi:hypothetical protein